MPSKLQRKMPRNIAEYESRTGWEAWHAFKLLNGGKCDPGVASAHLQKLASTYAEWFSRYPDSIHLFPLRGTIFHYEFAKGVRDAMFLAGKLKKKPKLRTIAVVQHARIEEPALRAQAKRLGLVNHDYVVHDTVSLRNTIGLIERASKRSALAINSLASQQTLGLAQVPLQRGMLKGNENEPHFRKREIVYPLVGRENVSGKTSEDRTSDNGRITARNYASPEAMNPKISMRLVPEERDTELNKEGIDFIKRALYSAGAAAARETLAKKK